MAGSLEPTRPMNGYGLIQGALAAILFPAAFALAQSPPVAIFKSSVDLVRVTVIARDHKGRFVQNLTARDVEIVDGGEVRPIVDFRRDLEGVSVALLLDVSGSMESGLADA